tara:strand:+ start:1681 stop:2082 length:402 start_codon:yes stop_codon:yes gene_type:complete
MQSDGEGWSICNDDQRRALLAYIEKNKHKDICFKVVQATRTAQQNKGIHAYCREVANQMAAMGLDMREVLKPTIEITPTMELIKNHIWKPVQKAITGEASTKAISKKDVDKVYQNIARHLSERYDISVPFGKK